MSIFKAYNQRDRLQAQAQAEAERQQRMQKEPYNFAPNVIPQQSAPNTNASNISPETSGALSKPKPKPDSF